MGARSGRRGWLTVCWLEPLFVFWAFSGFLFACPGDAIKGVYGVPPIGGEDRSSYAETLERAGVNAVFVPPEKETIRWFRAHGFRVYVAIDAFGGEGAWKGYPDARPVQRDGRLLKASPSCEGREGVCPTHPEWRNARFNHIRRMVETFGGGDGIDGIWLDGVRYPGGWMGTGHDMPDTCYCPRCLKKFQEDTGVTLPVGHETAQIAYWIRKTCPYTWVKWKKEQIFSFVRAVRDQLNTASLEKTLTLGVFLVPWRIGERKNAVSYIWAQDPFQLSQIADVISPKLYQRACGKNAAWVGRMVHYYKETLECQVCPVIEADVSPEGALEEVLKSAGQAGADGFVVSSFEGVTPEQWGRLKAFRKPVNLIVNPEFMNLGEDGVPSGWHRPKYAVQRLTKSIVEVRPSEKIDLPGWGPLARNTSNCLGIHAGNDEAGICGTVLPECEPGAEYLFTCLLYRHHFENGVYPAISIWGKEFLINTHFRPRRFHPVRVHVDCPEKPHGNFFRFINRHPGVMFWMNRPRLIRSYGPDEEAKTWTDRAFFEKDFFPIGIYGARMDELKDAKEMGFNTVVIKTRSKRLRGMVQRCHEIGLKYLLTPPRDPDLVPGYLDEIAGYVREDDLAFYVNDEPGIHAYPRNMAEDIDLLIKARFPNAATFMAVLRPQVCRRYRDATDFFLLDQYPVPHMPMIWLSDSMEGCAESIAQSAERVDSGRLASIIQAFGGEKWADAGWPRMPTWREMDCLAFLSLVHGSRGIFFFTYAVIGQTEEGRERLRKVVGRLHQIDDWLEVENLVGGVKVEIVSRYGMGSDGRPAVHACMKQKGGERLLVAVNTVGTFVEASFGSADYADLRRLEKMREVFSGQWYGVVDGKIRAGFGPYETKAFLLRRAQRAWRKAER